jgi:hypothetical protein
MTFKDFIGGGYLDGRSRARALEHLSNASKSVADPKHPVHGFLKKAAAEIGGVVVADRSEDNSGKPSDYTSPGTVTSDSKRLQGGQAPGASGPGSIVSGKAAKRDEIVQDLYKKAAFTKDRVLKAKIEQLAFALDKLEINDVEKMSAVDLECLKGLHGEEALRAAMRKAQSVAPAFQELVPGASKGKNNFQARHGF